MGRCTLLMLLSAAMSQAASAASPTSTSKWRIQVCWRQPRGRFNSSMSSDRWLAQVLTTRRSASCADTDPCRWRTWPNIEIHLSRTLLQRLCSWVWLITDTFGTKSNQNLIATWPGIESMVAWLKVRCLNHYITKLTMTRDCESIQQLANPCLPQKWLLKWCLRVCTHL